LAEVKVNAKKPGVAVIKAWRDLDKKQCGMCTSEQIMAAITLLTQNTAPTDAAIAKEMGGHTCDCLTAEEIYNVVKKAAADLNA